MNRVEPYVAKNACNKNSASGSRRFERLLAGVARFPSLITDKQNVVHGTCAHEFSELTDAFSKDLQTALISAVWLHLRVRYTPSQSAHTLPEAMTTKLLRVRNSIVPLSTTFAVFFFTPFH